MLEKYSLTLRRLPDFETGTYFLSENQTQMSQAYLSTKAEEYKDEGWRLHGLMREALKDNDVDIVNKILSWRKRQ